MEAVIDIYGAHPFWIWAAAGAALLALEVATGSGWLLWPAASAAVVGLIALVSDPGAPWSLLIFAILTIAATLLARRLIRRPPGETGGDINDNAARLLGREAAASQAFTGRTGRVFIDGKEWAAELEDDGELAAGERVRVVAVDGARLRVRATR